MPYQATVVNVMIAAPSDVEKEPKVIRQILEEWNETDAEHSRIVALPTGWQTHAAPESGERAQEFINRQVLEKADILVAVFWTRLGTPTGEYDSGTVEEIKKSIQDGRHVMLYFSDVPIQPTKVDQEQHSKLIAFREEMKSKALCGMFNGLDDFETQFRRDIKRKLQEFKKSPPESDAESALRSAPDWGESLSEEAQKLLTEAVRDEQARILCTTTNQGLSISVDDTSFCEEGNARSEAKWRRAVGELVRGELIEGVGDTGEVFRVTHNGFQVADTLNGNCQGLTSVLPQSEEDALSDEAKTLIAEAAQDREGQVRCTKPPLGLLHIFTNGQSFGSAGDPRSDARWQEVMKELTGRGLLEDVSDRGAIFRVTDTGYGVADALRAKE